MDKKNALAIIVLAVFLAAIMMLGITVVQDSGDVNAYLVSYGCQNYAYPGSSNGYATKSYSIPSCSYGCTFNYADTFVDIENQGTSTHLYKLLYDGSFIAETNVDAGDTVRINWFDIGDYPGSGNIAFQIVQYGAIEMYNIPVAGLRISGSCPDPTTTTTTTTSTATTTTSAGTTTTSTATTTSATTTITVPPPTTTEIPPIGEVNINVHAKVGESPISGLTIWLFKNEEILASDSGETNDGGDITFVAEENNYYYVKGVYEGAELISEVNYCADDWSTTLAWAAPADPSDPGGSGSNGNTVVVVTTENPLEWVEDTDTPHGELLYTVILWSFMIIAFLWLGSLLGSISRRGHPVLWGNFFLSCTLGTFLYIGIMYFFSVDMSGITYLLESTGHPVVDALFRGMAMMCWGIVISLSLRFLLVRFWK